MTAQERTRARYFQSVVYIDGQPHGRDTGSTVLTPNVLAAKLTDEYLERTPPEDSITISVVLGDEVPAEGLVT